MEKDIEIGSIIRCEDVKYRVVEIEVKDTKEEPLDLTKILKDVPMGTKLYSPIFGKCVLKDIEEGMVYPIVVYNDGMFYTFTKEGNYSESDDCECLLFPSKDNRDWSTFKIERPDLPVDTPCVVWDNSTEELNIRYYSAKGACWSSKQKANTAKGIYHWRYIVPISKFDFENLSYKPEDNYGSTRNY